MIEKRVLFPFKGDRTYIHGTDLFNAIMREAPAADLRDIQFEVHEVIRTPSCTFEITEDPAEFDALDRCATRCGFSVAGRPVRAGLSGAGGDPAEIIRQPYDEDRVLRLCRVADDAILLNGESPYSFIETIVPMNKALLTQLFPDAPGRWLFTRLILGRSCSARENLTLRFVRNFQFRLVRSDVHLGDKRIGSLDFSVMQP
jgi:hypothetical protein